MFATNCMTFDPSKLHWAKTEKDLKDKVRWSNMRRNQPISFCMSGFGGSLPISRQRFGETGLGL